MKTKLLIVLLLLVFNFSNGQNVSDVVEIDGVTASQLYTKANEWFALKFVKANEAIQMNDTESKQIIAKGISDMDMQFGKSTMNANIYFTLQCQFKDGKYRFEFSQVSTKLIGGEEYTSMEEWYEKSTIEGLHDFYKRKNINTVIIGKKGIEKNAADSKVIHDNIRNHLVAIAQDLQGYLTKETEDNW